MTILIFILVLGTIVFVHEFGHFIFAKLMGVYVYEFAIGMGPKLFGFKGKETEYCLRLIPIGGFCSLAGEEVDETKIKVPKKRRLQDKKPWQRFLIMFFGPGFNFIFAVLVLFFIALFNGYIDYEPIIGKVEKDFPAYEVGLEKGDRVLEVNEKRIKTTDDLSIYLAIANKKKETKITVKKKDGSTKSYSLKPKKVTEDGEITYRYGIGMNTKKKYGFINSVKYTFVKTNALFRQMFITLGSLFTGGVKVNQLAGPIGIYSIVGEQSKQGFASILYLMAFLSINVGFINLVPLPAFDGGHILFIIIEKIKGSPVSTKTENMIHTIGLALLMLLMIYITFNDIIRLFK